MKKILPFALFLLILAGGCKAGTPTPTGQVATPVPTDTPLPPTPTSSPTPTVTPTLVPTAEPAPESGLEANPQRIVFQAEDGTQLVGYYYPARYADAPVVVLSHWAGGNQRDWVEIALWLQNRRDEVTEYPQPGEGNIPGPWLDPSWFPPMPDDLSFAVFTFDFRGYGESEGGIQEAQDALAAFETAATLESVDPQRMLGIGASIGADGAPDGCQLYNQKHDGGCLGAFSLSPGNYLGMDFAEVVGQMEETMPPAAVWCLASKDDTHAYTTCEPVKGEHYRFYAYEGDRHGMLLLSPEVEPQPMELIQQFLGTMLGMEIPSP